MRAKRQRKYKERDRKRRKGLFLSFFLFLFCLLSPGSAKIKGGALAAEGTGSDLMQDWQEYHARFESVSHRDSLEENGFAILEDQVFPVTLGSFGEKELTLIPAMETRWRRLALFLADAEGKIVWKTEELETNYRIRGELLQTTEDIAAISFSDANRDGRMDILLITRCVNLSGAYAGIPYKVGDVLFQGEGCFYRDWRISDKLNRFGMNKSADSILVFARDGQSTEFLYTADNLEELLEQGFVIEEGQCYTRDFEKLGRLKVVPGTASVSTYRTFFIYLVNEQGEIVWSLQPMGDSDSFYSLQGINGRDVDGDGLKDLVVLARYEKEGNEGEAQVETRCSIYYQRTGGFEADTEFSRTYRCTEEDTMEDMIQKIREYWGWQVEP